MGTDPHTCHTQVSVIHFVWKGLSVIHRSLSYILSGQIKFQTKFEVSYTVTSGCSFWCKKKNPTNYSWDSKPDFGKDKITWPLIRGSYGIRMLFSWRKSFGNTLLLQYLHEHGKNNRRNKCDEKRVHKLNLH